MPKFIITFERLVNMKIKIGEKIPIVRGIRPEEGMWGPYQFVTPYNADGKIVVSIHTGEDSIKTTATASFGL